MVTTADVPLDESYVANVAANGRATATILTNSFKPWLIEQVSIEMLTAPAGADCILRKRGNYITRMIAAGDAAGGDPPVTLYQGEPLTVEWTGCTPGDQGKVTLIYRVVEYAG